MASSRLAICNNALGELPASAIATIDENSLQGRETRRAYPAAKEWLLEQHRWSFAKGRVALAAVTNDRDTEWAYAYALPAGHVPLAVVPVPETAYSPRPLYATTVLDTATDKPAPYLLVGSTIYTNVPDAYLDYYATDVSEALFTAGFVRALELELAHRVVLPITKDRARWRELKADAQTERERAIAADKNREPQTYGDYIPDTLLARL